METGPMLFVLFYNNIKIAGQWGYLLGGGISFLRFTDVKSNGFGDWIGFQ